MSKIISNHESGAQRWDLPIVSDKERKINPALMAKEIEHLKVRAYAEGYEHGREQGRKAGEAEMHAAILRLDQVLMVMHQPLAQLDDEVEHELVELAFAVARQIVRREIRLDPGQVMAVIREVLASLPISVRTVRLHLHPDDALLVREALHRAEGVRAWEVIDDPTVTRGGCRVWTENSHVDATIETRIAALAAQVMGGERESDSRAI